ncbi:hypothetical protein [Rhodococcus sp. BE178]|uniref:hypothetical protein n=1 Tax=Rhodococcus sp. BE178 TaxID=2817737 RepID=UPI003D1E0ECE
MTSPNPETPDGMLDGLGGIAAWSQKTQAEWETEMRGRLTGSTSGIKDFALDLMNKLGKFLADVAKGIGDGLIAVGGVIFDVITDIVGGVVNFFKNLGAAVLGKGPSFLNPSHPDKFSEGPLADISDGQRALIGKVEALDDNAGFCNLTMSKNWNISGNVNKWIPCQFDTYVTANKNAEKHGVEGTSWSGLGYANAPGIMLLAPGVWHINAQVTAQSVDTAFQYFEVNVEIFRMVRYRDTPTGPWTVTQTGLYSQTRFPGSSNAGYYSAPPVFKPVLIPEFVVAERFPTGEEKIGDAGYKVVVSASYRTSPSWKMIGGTLWSSLSATRMSVDTTNYSPPTVGTGTGVIPDGAAP